MDPGKVNTIFHKRRDAAEKNLSSASFLPPDKSGNLPFYGQNLRKRIPFILDKKGKMVYIVRKTKLFRF
jgi:hypothetical protein